MDNSNNQVNKKRKKGIDTSKRILDVASELFANNGYDSVSVRKIASGVGIKESSMYNHFSSKAKILETLFDQLSINASKMWVSDEDLEHMLAFMEPHEIFKNISFNISRGMDTTLSNTIRIVFTERFRNKQAANLYYQVVINEPVEFYTQFIRRMIDQGLVKKVDARTIAKQYNHVSVALTMEYFMAKNGIGDVQAAINNIIKNIEFFCDLMEKDK